MYKIYVKYGTFTLYGSSFQKDSSINFESISVSYNPTLAVTIVVWALARSLATTYAIIIIFFSFRYLDVSVP